MLVLTRKPAETIRIGNDVVIKVIRVGKGAVKIGIDAPASVRVMRGELGDSANPVPSLPVVSSSILRVVSDQFPHVA